MGKKVSWGWVAGLQIWWFVTGILLVHSLRAIYDALGWQVLSELEFWLRVCLLGGGPVGVAMAGLVGFSVKVKNPWVWVPGLLLVPATMFFYLIAVMEPRG